MTANLIQIHSEEAHEAPKLLYSCGPKLASLNRPKCPCSRGRGQGGVPCDLSHNIFDPTMGTPSPVDRQTTPKTLPSRKPRTVTVITSIQNVLYLTSSFPVRGQCLPRLELLHVGMFALSFHCIHY